MKSEYEKGVIIHAGIKSEFLRRGGTTEQWERVRIDPRKFYSAWRRIIGIEEGTTLPPERFRNIDPSTGELLR